MYNSENVFDYYSLLIFSYRPVSAYALFFRDTQAAIKGSSPNASFGEVSKIVASMWDSLDADNKSVYKKKTEAAKKEYLKALAAYRASLVSKVSGNRDVQVMLFFTFRFIFRNNKLTLLIIRFEVF